ncbi:MAG: hypothetical protein HEP71_24805 [Roseivirga sp.]|nr:hypothetical protein [Roseivirga sp.]
MYSYSICYPDKAEIEYPGKRLSGKEVIELVSSYPWVDQLKKLESIPYADVHYNPSIDFKNVDDNHSFCLTAEGEPDAERFSVWYAKPVVKKTWFGLSEKEVMDVVDKNFSKEDSFRLLDGFLKQNYDLLEKEIK